MIKNVHGEINKNYEALIEANVLNDFLEDDCLITENDFHKQL